MPKLTDFQLVILSAAARREDRKILPLPKSIKTSTAALTKTIKSLLTRGLIAEQPAVKGDEVWRETGDGSRISLVITDVGLEAIGVDTDRATEPTAPTNKAQSKSRGARSRRSTAAPRKGSPASIPKVREGTKQALLIDLLKRDDGATIDEIVAATGWQAHSVRGAMSGTLKKKLGLTIKIEVSEDRGRVYRIVGQQNAS